MLYLSHKIYEEKLKDDETISVIKDVYDVTIT